MKTEKRERYKYQMHLLLRLIKIYHGFAPELWWCVTVQAMLCLLYTSPSPRD